MINIRNLPITLLKNNDFYINNIIVIVYNIIITKYGVFNF